MTSLQKECSENATPRWRHLSREVKNEETDKPSIKATALETHGTAHELGMPEQPKEDWCD